MIGPVNTMKEDIRNSEEVGVLSPSKLCGRASNVSVVIVVWNAKRYAIECLESLERYCGAVCKEVIVVDNASTDGAPEAIEELFPNVLLIRNPENYGFAKANNIGITRCSGDYVCLVNSDVAFTQDCISPMVQYFTEHPTTAMLGPKMLGADRNVRRSTMRFPTFWNSLCRALCLDRLFHHSRLFGGLMMKDFDHRHTAAVEVLNGWFLLIRRNAIEKVGLLDPQFFMYGEDLDWCYRFHRHGEQAIFFAEAEAIHYGGSSSSTAPVKFYLEQHRANWQYCKKHHGWASKVGFLLTLTIHHGLRILGAGCVYVCRPARRSEARLKMSRSFICLEWVGQTSCNQ
jgi:hypothetical protein